MAVRKRIQHKKTGFVSVLASGLSHYVPLFVFLALCLNVVVVWRFEERQKPQVMYYVATNSVAVSSSAAPGSPSPGSLVSGFPTNRLLGACSASNAVVFTAYYDYFLFDGTRGAKMFDRLFYEGSRTSYGRIDTIFPDRILLENGSYIVNSRWSGGGEPSRRPSLSSDVPAISKERVRHDGI